MEDLPIILITTTELQGKYFEQQSRQLVLPKPCNVLIPHIRGTGNVYDYEKPEFKLRGTANNEYTGE